MVFKLGHDESKDLVSTFLSSIIIAGHRVPMILMGNTNWIGDKGQALVVAEKK